jgi:hypothetical protein
LTASDLVILERAEDGRRRPSLVLLRHMNELDSHRSTVMTPTRSSSG